LKSDGMAEEVRGRSLRLSCLPWRPLGKENMPRGFRVSDRKEEALRLRHLTALIPNGSGIYHPDVVVVLDEGLIGLVNLTEGLKPGGTLIVNTSRKAADVMKILNYTGAMATVDATGIAWKELGVPITNTTMLGALIKVTGVVALDALKEPVDHRFGRIASKNMAALQRAYDEVKII
jgi:2-oxoacid:acceptor oxidoreductase gamma subunit (pyruvate/2-ketoisovalerate family)